MSQDSAMIFLRTHQRTVTADLIRSMNGGDVIHGVAVFGATSVQENGRAITRGVMKMIGETPLTDGTCDLVECDVYIVPRKRTVAISEPSGSYDELDVDMCLTLAKGA